MRTKRRPIEWREGDSPRRDRSLGLSTVELETRLGTLGVGRRDLLLALERAVGGLSFRRGYFEVRCGLRLAFDGSRDALARTPDGRLLLCWAVQGDTRAYVTEDGEAWKQDGIADPHPVRIAADPLGFAEEAGWPLAVDLQPVARVLGL